MSEDRYKYFRIEAREILDELGRGALDLEKGVATTELVATMLRHAHTLKGAARVVKQRAIAEHAHALEDTLGAVRDVAGPPPTDLVNRVIAHVDDIALEMKALAPPAVAVATADATPAAPAEADQPLAAFRPAAGELDALLDGVFEAHVRLGALRPRIERLEEARHVAALMVEQVARTKEPGGTRLGGEASHDRLRSLAEDLRGMVGSIERDFASNVEHLDQELLQVREAAERLRLSPAGAIFTFLERAVRDVAQALHRRVVFEAHGGDIRVDPTALSVVQGALLHVVRNAAVHGIEEHERDRLAAGKSPEGHVSLRVSQRGRLISFVVSDDGRGIDLDAVRRIAQRKGLLTAAARPTPDALLDLLLQGGISTSQSVTAVSGRGIGLDVLREAAARLGGEATARTEPGAGTTVSLVVPLSIASFEALIVDAGVGSVALPLDAVRGTIRLAADQVVRTSLRESILFDGLTVPFVSLRQALAGTAQSASAPGHASAVVVEGRSGLAAFSAQRILGTAHVVMRPLPELTPAATVVAGAVLDAVGDPQLVLDPDTLVAIAQRGGALTAPAAAPSRTVLVVDDSLTTRMLEQSILESAGYRVDLARSGEEGLEKARAGEYDLFLVDVEMPGMDGFTFIRTIRADPDLRTVPAILVTSRNSPDDLQSGIDAGAQAHMVKSEFDQGVLLERIRTLIG